MKLNCDTRQVNNARKANDISATVKKQMQVTSKTIKNLAGLSAMMLFTNLAQAVVFQAEDYTAAFDTTAGNTGGAYRSDNVDIEATTDTGGGYSVGWVEQGEWLALGNLNIANSGTYKINVRAASETGGIVAVDLDAGNIPLGEFSIPNTGGWQSWQTISKTVTLNAGSYAIGTYATTGSWNLNWVEVVAENVSGGSSTKIQAEDYDVFFDSTPENLGGAYRNDAVDIEQTTDSDGAYNIGWVESGEWLVYSNVTIPSSGNYKIKARVASPSGGALSFDLNANAVALGQLNVPATGSWQNWQTISMDTYIDAGTYNLGLFVVTGGWNLNWIEISESGSGPNPTPTPTPPPGGNLSWSDEFDTINRSVWNFEVGGGGWGNNELQYYTDGQNASVQYDPQAGSNVLVIEARKEQGGLCWWGANCEYTSTRMNTRFNKSFKYGRIEARIKLPKAQGIWPAFWMLGDAFNSVGWPQGGEIDIMEHVGTNNITSGALHGPGYSGATPITGHLDHATDITASYKTYAVEWDANQIRWYVDDILFYTTTKSQVEQYGQWVYDGPFWILLNVAVGGNWPGAPDANYGTQKMYVDYVRVYQ
ncbi:Beta-glucanase [Thalassocella blandensis]|nr:Beta-glucanase [Thalassocella blandensis]